jgi:hypothetical protein
MPRDPRALLADTLDAAQSIERFRQGLDLEGFRADDLTRAAVERKLEIVGEALNRLSREDPEVAARIPDIARSDLRSTLRVATMQGRAGCRRLGGRRSRGAGPPALARMIPSSGSVSRAWTMTRTSPSLTDPSGGKRSCWPTGGPAA